MRAACAAAAAMGNGLEYSHASSFAALPTAFRYSFHQADAADAVAARFSHQVDAADPFAAIVWQARGWDFHTRWLRPILFASIVWQARGVGSRAAAPVVGSEGPPERSPRRPELPPAAMGGAGASGGKRGPEPPRTPTWCPRLAGGLSEGCNVHNIGTLWGGGTARLLCRPGPTAASRAARCGARRGVVE
ncbi:unnamed protein product, partial [Prorocentrum cordatum]